MITLAIENCSGCIRCEVHCSFFHSGKIGRSGARIKVVKIEDLGIDYPVNCQHCRERYCIKCPENAIEIGSLGQIIVSPTLCNACGTCEIMCPIGAIQLFEEIPYVCDLCGGDPRCVKACTMDAIHYEPEVSETVSLKNFKKESRRLNPEEKRLRYAMTCSQDLREEWTSERSG
ncbi:MAG: 4Fe-4S dicluster domain-containing protein [Desulfobacterales bacterium]